MSTLLQRQMEAIQRTVMNKNRAEEEMVAEMLNEISAHYQRRDDSVAHLTARANEIYERFSRALGGPPPLPEPIGNFLDEMTQSAPAQYRQ
jgi:predicted  nucleic acid-binding Zn-ribbon protein